MELLHVVAKRFAAQTGPPKSDDAVWSFVDESNTKKAIYCAFILFYLFITQMLLTTKNIYQKLVYW